MNETDVVVVGARCAGAATAMLLARRGYRGHRCRARPDPEPHAHHPRHRPVVVTFLVSRRTRSVLAAMGAGLASVLAASLLI